jgi:hypothetical protein
MKFAGRSAESLCGFVDPHDEQRFDQHPRRARTWSRQWTRVGPCTPLQPWLSLALPPSRTPRTRRACRGSTFLPPCWCRWVARWSSARHPSPSRCGHGRRSRPPSIRCCRLRRGQGNPCSGARCRLKSWANHQEPPDSCAVIRALFAWWSPVDVNKIRLLLEALSSLDQL